MGFQFILFSSLHDTIIRKNIKNFGGFSIEKKLFDYIFEILPQGKTILEFGSGWASSQLSKYYTVYSIEHDPKWLNKYETNYIYAPIKNGWYDIAVLKKELPKKYDLVLVDGPLGSIGRHGFYTHLNLFNLDIPIIFDDVQRGSEFQLLMKFAKKLDRVPYIFESGKKKFGVLIPN